MIKEFKENLKLQSSTLEKVLFVTALVSLFLTAVFLLLFSNNSTLNKLYYATFAIFGLSVVIDVIKKRNLFVKVEDIFIIILLFFILGSKVLNRGSSLPTNPLSVVLIYFVCSRFFNINNYKLVLKILLFAFVIFSVAFIIYYRSNIFSFNFNKRLGTYFENPNTVGYYFVYGGALCLFQIIKKKMHLLYIIPLLIMLFLCVFTGSRSALIIFIIIVLLGIYLIFGKKYIIVSTLICLSIILGIYLCLNLPIFSSFAERIIKSLSGYDSSTNERLTLVKEGLFLFLSKPLFGWGYNGTTQFTTNHLFSHNNFVELGADFGIFALISFEFLLIYPLYKRIRFFKMSGDMQKKINICFLILGSSIFAIQFFYANYQLKFEYIFMALFSVVTEKYYLGSGITEKKNKLWMKMKI